MSPHRVLAGFVLLVLLVPSVVRVAAHTQVPAPPGIPESEVVARGFDAPFGVAVSPSGAIVVSDNKAGTVVEIGPNGRRSVLLRRLDRPAGVAFDDDGALLIVETRAGRVLRRDPTGAVGILGAGMVKPQWIAVAADGSAYVSAKRERRTGRRDDDDDEESRGGERILQVTREGAIRTFAEGFRGLEGLAVTEGFVYAAVRRLESDRGRDETELVRFPLRPGGAAGPMQVVLRGTRQEPVGLAVDRLGALVASVRPVGRGRERGGVIKQAPAGQFVALASTLRSPQGVAFEPAGHLLVVEGEPARQIRRFRAPSPPVVTVPAFVNESPVGLSGRTVAGGLVRVFPEQNAEAVATAVADSSGAFTVRVPIAPNQLTRLSFTVTADGGRGLTSAFVSHDIVHDDHQPVLAVIAPPPGIYTRSTLVFGARAEDDGSGVASVSVAWDDELPTTFPNADSAQPFEVSASLSTASLAEGPRTFTVSAADRAGNSASTAQLVTVDRTPPETRITSGPAGEIAEKAATFVVEAADLFSPVVEFAWQLDGGGWSPFSLSSSIALTDLTPGPHRFEVKARDLAGNEDPTPAAQTFTVRSLRISILEPADGAIVTASSVWVRGTIEGGAGEVTVSVELPADAGGTVASPVEGGTFVLEVPADPALTPLTVVATDGSGATAQATVAVVFAPDGAEVQSLDLWPPGGLAPLPVRIGVHGLAGTSIAVDFEGDGTIDFEGEPATDNLYFTYAQAGIYIPTLRLTTPDGQVLTRRGLVEVYDPARLDARLQAVWAGFKDSLRKGDVAAAVSFIAAERRAGWGEYFASLSPDAFEDVDLVFTAIALVGAGYGGAQYEMVAERGGLIYSYAVWFQIDADGRWRLWRF